MGDIIHSERASSVAQLHLKFNAAVEYVNNQMPADIVSPLTITLGDEFQGLTYTVSGSLHAARTMRLSLLEQDIACRLVVGLVRLESPVNPKTAWNMMGAGLARARERLSEKRNPNAYRFSLPEDAHLELLLDAIGYSLTDIEDGWTDRQRAVAIEALSSELSSADLAAEFDVVPRTLYKIRSAAKFEIYRNQWNVLELAASEIDRRYMLT
jgi:hypothetical protein